MGSDKGRLRPKVTDEFSGPTSCCWVIVAGSGPMLGDLGMGGNGCNYVVEISLLYRCDLGDAVRAFFRNLS